MEDILAPVEATLSDIGLVIEDVVKQGDRESVLELRGRIEDLKVMLAYITERVDARVIEQHPWNVTHDENGASIPILVPGGGIGKIAGGKVPKRWDNEGLESAIVHKLAETAPYAGVITDAGEIETPEPIIRRSVRAAIDAAAADTMSFSGWRKGVLRAYGIDPEKYVTEHEITPLTFRIEGRSRAL